MSKAVLQVTLIFCTHSWKAEGQTLEDAFAVLKLSYNQIGESTVVGGISGSAFFINDSTALTAFHVLNIKDFKPNSGYQYCQFWLLSRNTDLNIPVAQDYLWEYGNIDVTVIRFDRSYDVHVFEISNGDISAADSVYSLGYVGGAMPGIKANWESNSLVIEQHDLSEAIADRQGIITGMNPAEIRANDVQLHNVIVIEPSFQAIEGMSGGPLITKWNHRVVGLMSFGLPPNSKTKDRVFAVLLSEIAGIRID